MCTVCGCAEDNVRVEDHEHAHVGAHAHGLAHQHDHGRSHAHSNDNHHYGHGPAHAHAPGMSQTRMVRIEQDILSKNDSYARTNRQRMAEKGVLAINLVSSPGSGKTTLLTRTLLDLKDQLPMAVIEGDQETSNDADRIRATGVRAIQINTGKGCHLDAHQVGHAINTLGPEAGSVLFIENVGNLVCPAAFDLGEAHKVIILSITEGEDKPIKYPEMFGAADLVLLNKIDLLPHLLFKIDKCVEYLRRVNSKLQILQISAITGQGMQDWYDWLKSARQVRSIGHSLQKAPELEKPVRD